MQADISHSRGWAVWAAAVALGSIPLSASAQWSAARVPAQPSTVQRDYDNDFTWVVGMAVNNGPVYPGSDRRGTGLRPAIGIDFGRFTLSTGGGGSLLDFDQDARDSGLSARLYQEGGFRLSAGLRLDSGRDGQDDQMLRGLPKVERTLRGRLSAIYDFSPNFSVRSSFSPDLLGKKGGVVVNNTMGYSFQATPTTEFTLIAGFTVADATYMRSYFGVPVEAAGVTTPLPAYRPGAGMLGTEVGFDMKTAVTDRWVLYGGMRYTQVRGDAKNSPIVVKPGAYSVSLGLAYRR